ncbi:MAG: preprotein translocase subunit SecD [Nanohaloarchaea archaeon]|nr:preprotein translocase subunit SecD [Candidatus Nanohaloarchaea archaeon]
MAVGSKYIQVEMAGLGEAEIREILEQQGKFEAKIIRHVEIKDGSGTLEFGGNYDVTLDNGTITVNDEILQMNDTITIEGIEFQYTNLTGNTVALTGLAYTGDDIVKVFGDAQHSSVQPTDAGYRFSFQIMVDSDAASRFAKLTEKVPVDFSTDISRPGEYLKENIDLYLDDILVDSLRIGSGLKGTVETTISISGPGETQEEAINNMRNMQAVMESGALPTQLEIIKIDRISPTLGKEFMSTAILAIIFSIAVVSIVIFIRYRDVRIVIPIMMTSLSEVLIILGVASLINWTIDLAAIAGIIAAVGTGVDDQIIIADESSKKEKTMTSLKAKLANAFFIIFTAAFTTIAAMVPLLFMGAGALRGFALTTIIGVLIGVLITRPAFGRVIKEIKEGN